METEKVKKEWSPSKLTNATAIRNTKYKPEYGVQKVFSCGGGLCFVVKPTSRSWLLRTPINKKQVNFSLGDYEYVDYAKAMELQKEIKQQIFDGIDPRIKVEKEKELTIQDAYNYYLEHFEMSANVRFKFKQAFDKHILENVSFKDKPLKSIKNKDVVEWLQEREKKQAEDGHGTYQIVKIHNRLISVFEYYVEAGFIDAVPTSKIAQRHIKRHIEKNYLCFDFSEMPIFYQKLSDYRSSKITKLMLNFLILTAMRSGELREMEWGWVNEDYILIPEDKHKTGKKLIERGEKSYPWYVFLSEQSKQLLKITKEITGDCKYVFPSPINFNKIASDAIFTDALERLEYKNIHQPHGFRSLYKTKMKSIAGNDEEYLELNLLHLPDLTKTAKHYTRDIYLMFHPERAELMQKWADIIDTQKANVI